MTKKIETLVDDIETMLDSVTAGATVEVPEPLAETFAQQIKNALVRQLSGRDPKSRTGTKTLRASEIGSPCHRKVWYSYHTPFLGTPMPGHTLLKFFLGDITESVLLLMAKLAGHEVTHEQEATEFTYNGWTVRGRMDGKIDGTLVDVKSASGIGTTKFKQGLDDNNDAFGYRAQLAAYTLGHDKDEAPDQMGFLVQNKENGRLMWSPATYESPLDNLSKLTAALEDPTTAPPRAFEDVPEGKSGNRKLCTTCSYCDFKKVCWPGLRGFAYAKGPVWLTEVAKTPDVPEIPLNGQDSEDSAA